MAQPLLERAEVGQRNERSRSHFFQRLKNSTMPTRHHQHEAERERIAVIGGSSGMFQGEASGSKFMPQMPARKVSGMKITETMVRKLTTSLVRAWSSDRCMSIRPVSMSRCCSTISISRTAWSSVSFR